MKFKATHLSSKASFTRTFYYSAMFLFLATNLAWGDNTHFPNGMNPDDQSSSPGIKPERVNKLIKTLETKPLAVRTADPLPIAETPASAPCPVATPEPRPVVKLDVLPHPIPIIQKAAPQPIDEPCSTGPQQVMVPQEEILFSKVFEERPPLAILDVNQDPQMQQWVLFASASRGVKKGIVEIVHVYGDRPPSSRGKDVQALLIQMGIQPEQLVVIYAKAERPLIEKVYLFVKEKGQ